MLAIGEFSRICMVTAKTLRHYDGIGLLKPARYHAETGYRFYDASQLKDMQYIKKLKSYGFSLEEIKELLHADGMALKRAMEKKFSSLAKEIEEQKSLLSLMEKDIWNLEKGLDFMNIEKMDIKLVETIDTNMVSVRGNIAIRDFDKLFLRLTDLMEQTGAVCAGGLLAIYHSPEFDPEDTDLEIGYPVTAASDHTRTLKGGPCAAAVHKGEYGKLHETYTRLGAWIDSKGYAISAPPYEIYLNDPREVPPDQLITEVYFPINK
jgi:DNA-binding transcriptional MerR regulator/predicted transcriptional regulator YdeE